MVLTRDGRPAYLAMIPVVRRRRFSPLDRKAVSYLMQYETHSPRCVV